MKAPNRGRPLKPDAKWLTFLNEREHEKAVKLRSELEEALARKDRAETKRLRHEIEDLEYVANFRYQQQAYRERKGKLA